MSFSADLHTRRCRLHAAGLTDEEMAVKECTTKNAIVHWRNRAKLKMNQKPKPPEKPCAVGANIKTTGRRCGNCAHYQLEKNCTLCRDNAERPQWEKVKNGKRS